MEGRKMEGRKMEGGNLFLNLFFDLCWMKHCNSHESAATPSHGLGPFYANKIDICFANCPLGRSDTTGLFTRSFDFNQFVHQQIKNKQIGLTTFWTDRSWQCRHSVFVLFRKNICRRNKCWMLFLSFSFHICFWTCRSHVPLPGPTTMRTRLVGPEKQVM